MIRVNWRGQLQRLEKYVVKELIGGWECRAVIKRRWVTIPRGG